MLEPFELRRVQSDDDDLEDEIYCAAKHYDFEEVSDVEQFLINFRCTFFPFCASVFPCRKEISAIICRRKLISIAFFRLYIAMFSCDSLFSDKINSF